MRQPIRLIARVRRSVKITTEIIKQRFVANFNNHLLIEYDTIAGMLKAFQAKFSVGVTAVISVAKKIILRPKFHQQHHYTVEPSLTKQARDDSRVVIKLKAKVTSENYTSAKDSIGLLFKSIGIGVKLGTLRTVLGLYVKMNEAMTRVRVKLPYGLGIRMDYDLHLVKPGENSNIVGLSFGGQGGMKAPPDAFSNSIGMGFDLEAALIQFAVVGDYDNDTLGMHSDMTLGDMDYITIG